FPLTGAQQRAIADVTRDLCATRPMNRLVQGDVGSGKTMVAAAAIWYAAQSGLQSALMAPTEILAEQHSKTLAPLLERFGLRCALLTAATRAGERRAILAQLAAGELTLVIGTQALLSPDVQYRRLGLVVTDEQHRFGVDQRAALGAKGDNPHLLVMSATPIPRTLALMIYGDLDVSLIDELPPGRQRVDTYAVNSSYRPRIYAFIRRLVAQGRQVYVVCPMVAEHDAPGDERKAVTAYAETLRREVFPELRVAALHGRLKPKEKDALMRAFAAGETDVLVSTTVIEVGVDVPNAALMLIENAECFGLSQLHQLRGRVGRGQHKSYCILLSDNDGEDNRRRLAVMQRSSNGFEIAEEDLKLRGPGDFFGARQHGLPTLRVADLQCDMELLHEARAAAEQLSRADPALDGHPVLRRRIDELFALNAAALN
nr:ATP-dependent DNA helicase RecG [Oscillospiraceae bacterium]